VEIDPVRVPLTGMERGWAEARIAVPRGRAGMGRTRKEKLPDRARQTRMGRYDHAMPIDEPGRGSGQGPLEWPGDEVPGGHHARMEAWVRARRADGVRLRYGR